MTTPDEGNSENGKEQKPCMLPTGEQAKAIVEVLAEMYRTAYKPEDIINDEAKDEHASQ